MNPVEPDRLAVLLAQLEGFKAEIRSMIDPGGKPIRRGPELDRLRDRVNAMSRIAAEFQEELTGKPDQARPEWLENLAKTA